MFHFPKNEHPNHIIMHFVMKDINNMYLEIKINTLLNKLWMKIQNSNEEYYSMYEQF